MDKFVTMQIRYEIIEEFLRFPEGLKIKSCLSSNDTALTFHIEGAVIPDDMSGKEAYLLVHRKTDRAGNFILETELKE